MTHNRILTDSDRKALSSSIEFMIEVCPEMMSRKIAEANVQQAFVFDFVRMLSMYKKDAKIISVGCFEDTAFETLKKRDYNIIGIDPAIDFDLHSYLNGKRIGGYDIAFSTSVIEHVKNDEEFIRDMCILLNNGGYGVLTTDFKEDYKKGDPLPYSDERFYTRYDLEVRLRGVIRSEECDLLDEPDYSGKDNFVYQGHHYSFATFVFRKKENV